MRKKQYALKISIQTINDEGVVVQTWQDAGAIVGIAVPDAAGAKQDEQGLVDAARYKLYTRARAGVVVGNKITVNGKDLTIVAVSDYDRMCEVVLADVIRRDWQG